MTLFQLSLVYDWGYNGNITQYVATHPRASRASLVRKTPVAVVTNEIYKFDFSSTRRIAFRRCEGSGVPS